MKHAYLLRDEVTSKYIRSRLLIDGEEFQVIERPWLNNKSNESCIPVGTYKVTYLPRSASGRYRKVFHIRQVEGRSGILIHQGNLVEHSKGCLIIGKRRGRLGSKAAVLNSKTALNELNKITGGEDFTLQILGSQVVR